MTNETNHALGTRTLGTTSALTVSTLGLGCMGMSEFYGTGDEQQGIDTIRRALDLGVSFLDTADMNGPFTNERLVGKAIAGRRDDVQLATKFGNEQVRLDMLRAHREQVLAQLAEVTEHLGAIDRKIGIYERAVGLT